MRRNNPLQSISRRTRLTAADRAYLRQVKETVVEILPDAELILFGSRARGQAHAESDWDILILTDQPVDYPLEDSIREALMPIEIESGNVLPVMLETRSWWESPLNRETPFFQNVSREGVKI